MRYAPKPKVGRPSTGKALSAAERMKRYRARQRALGLRTVTRLEAPVGAHTTVSLDHRILDARSLAMHCMAAAKVEQDRSLFRTVKKIVDGWLARYPVNPPAALEEWRGLLSRPWAEVRAIITDPSERATRLRQSSPFATLLSPKERKRIYDAFRP